jgi:arylsulfatase A-like enzyme
MQPNAPIPQPTPSCYPGCARPRDWISLLASMLGLLVLGCQADDSGGAAPPNIILLISDDQGYTDYGFMGSPHVETPNLDRLAEAGFVFDQARGTSSVCRPSLLTLLTGLDPMQIEYRMLETEVSGGEEPENWLPPNGQTLPAWLAEHGYVSFLAGKHWEGPVEAAGFTSGRTDQIAQLEAQEAGVEPAFVGRATMQPVYDFIDTNADHPFLLWFSPRIPHLPHNAPFKLRARYRGKGLSRAAQRYYAMCTWYDQRVGELLAHIETKGIAERTLVIHLADNGWDQQTQNPLPLPPLWSLLGGDRGKLTMHDLGLRTPLVVSWPGHVVSGARSDALVSTLDVVPTILDLAGISPPPSLPGVSLRGALEGGTPTMRHELVGSAATMRPNRSEMDAVHEKGEKIVMLVPGRSYEVRTAEWHYIQYTHRDQEALYRIVDDPMEQTNLIDQYPEEAAQFRDSVRRHHERMTAPSIETARRNLAEQPRERSIQIECLEKGVPRELCQQRLQ